MLSIALLVMLFFANFIFLFLIVGGIPPFNLFYNRTYSYITIGFCPKIILKRYPCESDVEFIENCLKDVLFNKLKVPKEFVESI